MVSTASVSAPTFSVSQGTYPTAQQVNLTADEGCSIYYTLDGITPTNESTLFVAGTSISITETTTIKAIAINTTSNESSSVVSATYTIKTPITTISALRQAPDGAVYWQLNDVVVTNQVGSYLYVEDAGAGIVIYGASGLSYKKGDLLLGTIIATKETYYGLKEITSPDFSQVTAVAGTEKTPLTVTLDLLLKDLEAYDSRLIKLEGCTASSSTIKQDASSIAIYDRHKILTGFTYPKRFDLIGYAGNYKGTTSQIYVVDTQDIQESLVPQTKVDTPVFSPTAGTEDKPVKVIYGGYVTVSTPTEGATIYNGDSEEVTAPIRIISALQQIEVYAVKEGLDDSEVMTGCYEAYLPDPAFSLPGNVDPGSKLVLSCWVAGSSIYYTLNDGETQLYESPIVLTEDCQIEAYAVIDKVMSGVVHKNFTMRTPQVLKCLFKETFDQTNAKGGNDGTWNDSGVAGDLKLDNLGWQNGNVVGASQCVKVGFSSTKGSFTTPELGISGKAFLKFRAGAWSDDIRDLVVLVNEVAVDTLEIPNEAFEPFQVSLPTLTPTDRIKFSARIASKNRFFLDDVLVYRVMEDKTSDKQLVLDGPWTHTALQDLFKTNPDITGLDMTSMTLSENETVYIPENSNCLIYASSSNGLSKNEVIDHHCANLVLTDKQPYAIPADFTATKASYTRQAYQDGGWETIMLPYDLTTLPTDYQFEAFSKIDLPSQVITFEPVDHLVANTPYLMRYIGADATPDKQGSCSFAINDGTVYADAEQTFAFKGTTLPISGEGKYILNVAGTAFGKGTATSTIAPFHAYLEVEASPQQASSYRVVHATDQVTALTPIENENLQISTFPGVIRLKSPVAQVVEIFSVEGCLVRRVFLLNGLEQEVRGLAPGIYLIAGHKVCIQ